MYLAPEVLQGEGYSQAADIWSMGIILFQMAAGEMPFSEADPYVIEEEIKG